MGGKQMPVFTPQQLREEPELSSNWSAYGVMHVARGESIRPHFHDCDEWWIITGGRALVVNEGEEHEVEAGHMVATPMGEDHGVLEVYSDLTGVWLEGELRGRKRRGHLHHPEDD
jgi:mannose-6-phosphate isomerase-like protein (cupin superfamily)